MSVLQASRNPTKSQRAVTESWKHALGMVNRFLIPLVQTLAFEATPSSAPLLAAVRFLNKVEGSKRYSWRAAPSAFVPKSWEDAVYPSGGEPDKPSYQEFEPKCWRA